MVRPLTIIVFDTATQMPDHVRQADYFHVAIPDKPGEAARVLALLSRAGVNMIGFCGFPRGAGKSQLDFIAEDSAAFKRAAKDLGFKLSAKKQAFVIQGTDRPGADRRCPQCLGTARRSTSPPFRQSARAKVTTEHSCGCRMPMCVAQRKPLRACPQRRLTTKTSWT